MRRVFSTALVAMCALAIEAASGRDDKKGLPEGAYTIIAIEIGGKPIPKDLLDKATDAERALKITSDTIIATKGGKDDPATYTINSAQMPPQINMTAKRPGSSKDDKMYGIYKLDGDTLTICLVTSDDAKDRPAEFKTAPNSQAVMMTLKRNPTPALAPAPAPAPPKK
ncbi:TIGR03067 domain-containing protein [Frigoriglobus tundricola]|uniref:TIGR03067 domain-containing protein n=1 Tax=Frigoriglobus tundricola TaxID=2774151 RepID=A0A6M5YJY8_9BACT|nr:TIGR03067 domain-containing protein [Frigoriglobus tundricola]QJW94308.1 hypothetical protein FTUN_1828 [Frigoriglobus tundricola]